MYAVQVSEYGGPEVLVGQQVPTPTPGAGEALVNIKAIGINFIDIYHRTGTYKGALPFTPGMEAAGVVEAIGSGVTEVKVGDRVAYAQHQGSYAEYVAIPAAKLVPLPDGVDFKQGAAAMLQALTAHYLCHTTYPVKPGDVTLVHAGAGGVGLLLTQMLKLLGATVISTVSTPEKAELSRAAGADHVILYTEEDFEAEVKNFNGGKGIQVVYDSVGKTTFDKSINCLGLQGYMVLYGGSSGPVPPVDPILLMSKGSLFLTRPTLGHYIATRDLLLSRSADIFGWIASGKLKLRIEHVYPLSEVAQAHIDLTSRATTGKLVLVP